MKSTRVVQFETRALEAERQGSLARERRAARASRAQGNRVRRFRSALAVAAVPLEPGDCEA